MFTAKTNPFNTAYTKSFNKTTTPQLDYDKITDACKQNLDAFAQTQKSAFDTLYSLADMQNKFAHQAIQGLGSFMKNMKNAKTVEEKTQLQSQAFKEGLDKVVEHSRGVSEHITKNSHDISTKVGQNVRNNINHVQEVMKKTQKSS